MNRFALAGAVMLCAAGSSMATTVLAADEWKFGASIYGYLPTIGGKTNFPSDGGSDVTIDVNKILDSLKFNFAGTLDASHGRWGGFMDVYYADLGNMKSGTRDFEVGHVGIPGGATANLDYDLKATVWTLAGSYRAASSPTGFTDIFAGARMLDMSQSLKWELSGSVASIPLPSRNGQKGIDARNWDGIVGLKGRAAFGENDRWFVPYYADIGTGESDLTWQAFGGLGYAFSWGEVVGVWRYIDYKFKSGNNVESLNTNGPAIGAVFHW